MKRFSVVAAIVAAIAVSASMLLAGSQGQCDEKTVKDGSQKACPFAKKAACPADAQAKADCKVGDKDCPPSACTEAERAACAKGDKAACTMSTKDKTASAACKMGDKDCPPEACKGMSKSAEAKPSATITPAALNTLLAANSKVTVLDARAGDKEIPRVPGAKVLDPGASAKDIASAVPDKESAVVTYCGSTKCTLSNKLATRLQGMGYKNVIEMPEGIAGWTEAGLETTPTSANM